MPFTGDLRPCKCLAVLRDEKIAAVAVYNNYRDASIELSFAAETPRWATRDAIGTILWYPFGQLRCRRIGTIAPARHAKALKLNRGIGFREVGVFLDFFPNDNGIAFEMTRRWFLRSKWSGQERAKDSKAA